MNDRPWIGEPADRQSDAVAFAGLGLAGAAMVFFAVSAIVQLSTREEQVIGALTNGVPAAALTETSPPQVATNQTGQDVRALDPAEWPRSKVAATHPPHPSPQTTAGPASASEGRGEGRRTSLLW